MKRADLANLGAVIAEAKKAVISAAIAASNGVNALRDSLAESAKTEARKVLLAVFPEQVVKLLASHLNYALAVKALHIDFLPWVSNKEAESIANARKLRGQLQILKGNAPTPAVATPELIQIVPTAKEARNKLGVLA